MTDSFGFSYGPRSLAELLYGVTARSGSIGSDDVGAFAKTSAPFAPAIGQGSETSMASARAGVSDEDYKLRLAASLLGLTSSGPSYTSQTISPGISGTVGPFTGLLSRDFDRTKFDGGQEKTSSTRYGGELNLPLGSGSGGLSYERTPQTGRQVYGANASFPVGSGALEALGLLTRSPGMKPDARLGLLFRTEF